MALDYRKCAQEIVDHIGGRDNVAQAAHCATRLRLVIKDNSKVDKEYLDNVEGVKGMFESNGQLQLIIGTGTVNKVYDEFLSITGMTAATKDDVKAAAAAKQPLWKQLLKPIGDVFVPILPAIVASGLMMGLVEALGKIPGLNFAGTDWYAFLDMVANTAFAYLPVIVAISAARVFGGNIFLGAVIGLLMIHSALTNGWNAAAGYDVWYLFGHIRITDSYSLFQINQLGYQGHVIPVIIAVLLMSNVEKWFHKHVPEMLDLFITPLCTVLITALVTFTIIGPIFSGLETMVLNGAQILVKNPLGAMVMGAIYPVTVVMGLHHMYNVIEAGMLSSVGLNTWMPIASAANFAQFGACLAVGLKSQSNKTKVIAVPSALSAALGITEPAIFGVNLRFYKPFVAGMVGGAIGSIFGAITGIGATAYGVTGIPGYLTINNAGVYTVLLLVSGGIAFAGTWTFWKEEVKKPVNKPVDEAAAETEKFEQKPVITCEAGTILAPIDGNVIPQDKIPDETFASGVLGAGVGIEPEGEVVYAPFDGEVSSVADSKHAIGLSGPGDMEVLIHVGVDTVAMNGEGFEPLVEDGDKVKAGQPILRFSKAAIKAADHPDVVVVLLTNSDDYNEVSV
ncbi:PTS beta-glucoside transporter subunit IIBCA [Oribacterium sp. NK2B42]|uniref:PTS beta-glucoside transporter subunit IIBCA n=1 Tax=Oribacterium sp. NK2B42 TaxID=689781 RepID=UPI0004927827|nr:PTS transporter subunit IIBCA [Oribacterium sp. NK2B42]